MGCTNCGSGGCSTGGCGQNGGCATGGCNKLNTYDWLGNMLDPNQVEVDNVYEVRFKNTRKEFFRNVNGLNLYTGDCVVVENDRGYDVGAVSLGGVLAELQMRKKAVKAKANDLPRIYRKANEADLELLEKVRDREQETLVRSREIIEELKLDMKLSDVEFQGDNSKAIFYYIADHRVDFRELIKVLAREFRIRVEMKQIGLRHEAGLVGGIGSCGRELCCATWLTDFKTVSTSAARYQNMSLNPMKISGLCGRLKCCLNFELEAYLDALQDFPQVEKISTSKGTARLQKTDIFKRTMWFSYIDESTWYPMSVDQVQEIVAANERGEKPEINLKANLSVSDEPAEVLIDSKLDFVDVVGRELPSEKQNNNRGRRKKKTNQGGNKSQNRRKKGGGGGGGQKGGNNRQTGGDNSNRPQGKKRSQDADKKSSSGRKPAAKSNQPKSEKPNQEGKPKRGGRGGRGRGGRNRPNNSPNKANPNSKKE